MLAQGNHLRSKPLRDSGTDNCLCKQVPRCREKCGRSRCQVLAPPERAVCTVRSARRCRGWLSGPPKIMIKQEAQLMLTNLRDAFGGQSRSPNIVPFHMLGIVSCCAIVTLSLRRAIFTIFDFKKCPDLEVGVKGHSRSLRVISIDRYCMVS